MGLLLAGTGGWTRSALVESERSLLEPCLATPLVCRVDVCTLCIHALALLIGIIYLWHLVFTYVAANLFV